MTATVAELLAQLRATDTADQARRLADGIGGAK